MYYKDHTKPYTTLQDANIEIELMDMESNEIEGKIIIWEGDFDYILSQIPLNNNGEYSALAYHHNIDFPWYCVEPEYWSMDCLEESLEQIRYVKDRIEDGFRKEICEDILKIIYQAIDRGNAVLIRRY